ncbi:bacterial bifunctional deaminase-reductase [Rickenella mellea]|uniref:2,5-diamino-6-ribosylamino-4(3H)-pyrimidinone 5'-phosphate reductase n=1 Tax=Rickenella mellea TaxID=50990 RepID=A0A4Y7QLE5_9AGAM|nr:bacterial bifunctional deaminase-reductase [Rickenella mellea]
MSECVAFLKDVLTPSSNIGRSNERITVTLTFAQSLDAKIAGLGKQQLILSGKESMLLTHWMRSMHDAILIGVGTALNDDPQLNVRLLPPEGNHIAPQPIILDSTLRFQPSSKLLKNFRAKQGRQPWIVTKYHENPPAEYVERKQTLEAEGAVIIPVEGSGGHLSVSALLEALYQRNVRSLMVEGGATVISSFLISGHVDNLIVTVAPTFVGEEGLSYEVGGANTPLPSMEHLNSLVVGRDTVVAWKVLHPI